MNNYLISPKRIWPVLPIVLALAFVGCGDSTQQKAYEQVAKTEQQLGADNSQTIIQEYRKVIAMDSGSDWAKKAAARIDAVETRLKAEEMHKSVFQEHGID